MHFFMTLGKSFAPSSLCVRNSLKLLFIMSSTDLVIACTRRERKKRLPEETHQRARLSPPAATAAAAAVATTAAVCNESTYPPTTQQNPFRTKRHRALDFYGGLILLSASKGRRSVAVS